MAAYGVLLRLGAHGRYNPAPSAALELLRGLRPHVLRTGPVQRALAALQVRRRRRRRRRATQGRGSTQARRLSVSVGGRVLQAWREVHGRPREFFRVLRRATFLEGALLQKFYPRACRQLLRTLLAASATPRPARRRPSKQGSESRKKEWVTGLTLEYLAHLLLAQDAQLVLAMLEGFFPAALFLHHSAGRTGDGSGDEGLVIRARASASTASLAAVLGLTGSGEVGDEVDVRSSIGSMSGQPLLACVERKRAGRTRAETVLGVQSARERRASRSDERRRRPDGPQKLRWASRAARRMVRRGGCRHLHSRRWRRWRQLAAAAANRRGGTV
eukprot:scaffold1333_cov274-Prasinococcus_capsulatus_cf.AAC.3